MWILVKNGGIVRTITDETNVKGNTLTFTNLKLVDRSTRVADGIYDFVEATPIDASMLQTGEQFNIDSSTGTVTRVFTSIPKPAEMLAKEMSDKTKAEATQELINSDTHMSRVVEDLIDLLISKNMITHSDLPADVVTKLNSRIIARNKLRGS